MNSAATLNRAVKMLVRGMNHVVDYVEDLLVDTPTWEDIVGTLRELFRRQVNIIVRPRQHVLGAKMIDFLVIGSER
ncbi:Zinc finger protein [Plakobranchus ocellatus]|uniref:Zinc finger protein n=1 Tax=Plakobranchus ocellatus TaxID=259542 RepID=A0AAV3XUR6_9GAST|nr:Zinc finger protein [Plakobranchus ocellatus]